MEPNVNSAAPYGGKYGAHAWCCGSVGHLRSSAVWVWLVVTTMLLVASCAEVVAPNVEVSSREETSADDRSGFHVEVRDQVGFPIAGALVRDDMGTVRERTGSDGRAHVASRRHSVRPNHRSWPLVVEKYGYTSHVETIDPSSVGALSILVELAARPVVQRVEVADVRHATCETCRIVVRENDDTFLAPFEDGSASVPTYIGDQGTLVWWLECPVHRSLPEMFTTSVAAGETHLEQLDLYVVPRTSIEVEFLDVDPLREAVIAFMPQVSPRQFESDSEYYDVMFRDRFRHVAKVVGDGVLSYDSLARVSYRVVAGFGHRRRAEKSLAVRPGGRVTLARPEETAAVPYAVKCQGDPVPSALVVPGRWDLSEIYRLVLAPRSPPSLHEIWASDDAWEIAGRRLAMFGGGVSDVGGNVDLYPIETDTTCTVLARSGSFVNVPLSESGVLDIDLRGGSVVGAIDDDPDRATNWLVLLEDRFSKRSVRGNVLLMSSGVYVRADAGRFRFPLVAPGRYVVAEADPSVPGYIGRQARVHVGLGSETEVRWSED